MWIFTEVADWFDKTRADNDAWIDQGLQEWVGTTLYDDSPWYRNVGVYVASGTLYALNKFTTTVAAGFVDVLRLGDGVKEGGWGYGKDALRLLMILGPAARGARYAATLVEAVDVSGGTAPNCTWVAASRLLRFTGTRPLAEVGDVANASGLTNVGQTGPAWGTDLLPALRSLGAEAKAVDLATEAKAVDLLGQGAGSTEQALSKVVAANPNGVVMFSVRWMSGGQSVGHSLLAVRDFFGGISIIDRLGGATVKSLAELESTYAGISSATVDANAVVAQNTALVKSLGTVPSLMEVISQAAPQSGSANSGGSSSAPSGGSGGSPSGPPGTPLDNLPPDAQRLYNFLPPGIPMDWKLLLKTIQPPLSDPYGSLQLLEKTGRVSVTRFGGDELNIRTVTRVPVRVAPLG